jgi:hypothetical protein
MKAKTARSAKPTTVKPKRVASAKKRTKPVKKVSKLASKVNAVPHAALEATGLAEQVLQLRKIDAEIAVELIGKTYYAIVRVKVEDLPKLLG